MVEGWFQWFEEWEMKRWKQFFYAIGLSREEKKQCWLEGFLERGRIFLTGKNPEEREEFKI